MVEADIKMCEGWKVRHQFTGESSEHVLAKAEAIEQLQLRRGCWQIFHVVPLDVEVCQSRHIPNILCDQGSDFFISNEKIKSKLPKVLGPKRFHPVSETSNSTAHQNEKGGNLCCLLQTSELNKEIQKKENQEWSHLVRFEKSVKIIFLSRPVCRSNCQGIEGVSSLHSQFHPNSSIRSEALLSSSK